MAVDADLYCKLIKHGPLTTTAGLQSTIIETRAVQTSQCKYHYTILDILKYFALDEDECTSGATDCREGASCVNTIGSYSCTCKAGFSGDGTTCEGKSSLLDARFPF